MVSVIIPAYNCGRYLNDAVESVIAQTYKDVEVIIVNDASADDTLSAANALAGRYRAVRVYDNETNRGVAQTRNRAIALSQGEYIAFLDADDRWRPDKIKRQLDFMQAADTDLCYTAYAFIDGCGRAIRRPYAVPGTVTYKRLLRENVIGLSSVLVRRAAIGDVRMRPDYAHEDYVFWLELMQRKCKMGGVNEPLMEYRISETNRSGNKMKAVRDRWKIYRRFVKMGIAGSMSMLCVYMICGVLKRL